MLDKEELIKIRRDLHKIPEIGTKEFKTSAYIKSKLDEFGIFYKECYNTGVIGIINPEKSKKTILLRADIDALPQDEKTGLDFSSTHKGMMHACGHDFHMTCLLGAAYALKTQAEKIDAKIVLLFQPDEEDEGGALPMINEGALDGVDAAFALHIEPMLKTGTIQVRDGSIMASPDEFSVEITGKSGHGACPENCINPISVAGEIISEFHKIPQHIKECVVTVCNINAGTGGFNIIPDTAVITGTARTITPKTRNEVENALNDICNKICKAYNADCNFNFRRIYPPLINDKNMNSLVVNAASKTGLLVEVQDKCSMTGEDFAYIAERVPSSFFKLGTAKEELGIYPLHNSKLNPDEDALMLGVKILVQIVKEFMEV